MGKRQEGRQRIEAAIVEIGRKHLVTEGAAGLSLRAVARDLGMVSSAVYRYVQSRDDLLTLLVVDAYTELADAVLNAVQDHVKALAVARTLGEASAGEDQSEYLSAAWRVQP